jgi:hypothetical protein
VFVNFGGALYEHGGSSWETGWKYVTSSVTDFSASQVGGDTVFVLKSGALSEYVGTVGTFITDNVSQVSAGIDSNGQPAAFILDNSGNVSEHTGVNLLYGWAYIASGSDYINASQVGYNSVYYTYGYTSGLHLEVHEHNDSGYTLVVHLTGP